MLACLQMSLISDPMQPGAKLLKVSACVQMKLISEPYNREHWLLERGASGGRLLKQMMLALRLHFAHVTEHIQEMAKHTMHIVDSEGQSSSGRVPAPRERSLLDAVEKLVCLFLLELAGRE
jgi:hypothetical protein